MDLNTLHTICILGAGKEGISTVQFLQELYPHLALTLADTQHVTTSLHVELRCGERYPHDLSAWDLVIVSPGIPPSTPLLQSARAITTATNIFFDHCQGKIIGVTGSKGKSTTSSLIAHILQHAQLSAHLVGNIGTPALSTLRTHNTPEDIFVYELSSYQTSRLVHGPDIAVVVNLFPEHINYHGSLEQYYKDKMNITTTQTPQQCVVYNALNTELRQRIPLSPARALAYPDHSAWHATETVMYRGTTPLCGIEELQLKGKHNVENCLAALTVASMFSIPDNVLRDALLSFAPLSHRLQNLGIIANIEWVDDAISTTPESTLAALYVFKNTRAIILGGLDRGYDFTALAREIAQRQIPVIVYFPDSGKNIEREILSAGYIAPHILHTSTMTEAVAFIARHTPEGSTALLSCASPSYTIFKNFEDKGDQFQRAVREL